MCVGVGAVQRGSFRDNDRKRCRKRWADSMGYGRRGRGDFIRIKGHQTGQQCGTKKTGLGLMCIGGDQETEGACKRKGSNE